MKTLQWFNKQNPSGIVLPSSSSASATSVSTFYNDNIIECVIGALVSGEIVTIETPFGFEITDAYSRVLRGGNVSSKTVIIKNTTAAVTNAMSVATDAGVARATTIDTGHTVFLAGDNDLNIVSSDHASGSMTVYIKVRPS